MSKSKKRLIDAEKFSARLAEIAGFPFIMKDYSSNNMYGADPLSQAIHSQINLITSQIEYKVNQALEGFLRQISWAVTECTYEDHPCLLCREDDNIPNHAEEYGDCRPTKTQQ